MCATQQCRELDSKGFKTFAERVGFVMHALGVDENTIADLVSTSDVNGTNLEKAEFRQAMRSLGRRVPEGGNPDEQLAASTWLAGEHEGAANGTGKGCTDRELDTSFASLDADKSGELDVTEVSRYLMSLKAAITRKRYEKSLDSVLGLRAAAQAFERAAPLATALESGEEITLPPRSLAARLGIFLKEKGVKEKDIAKVFTDSDGNGKIVEEEFSEAVVALGFKAKPKELGGLFKGFDSDRSGHLAIKELVACLKDLSGKAAAQLAAESAVVHAAAHLKENAETEMREGLRLAAMHFQAAATEQGPARTGTGTSPGPARSSARAIPAAAADSAGGSRSSSPEAPKPKPKLGWGKMKMAMKRASSEGAPSAAGASETTSKAGKDAEAEAREAARFKVQSSAEVRALAADLEKEVRVEEEKLDAKHKSYATVLGEAFLKLNKPKVRPYT